LEETVDEQIRRPLRVAQLIATRATDSARGSAVFMNPEDARSRLLNDGELAWVYGPRRHELATVYIDEALKKGDVVLRDVAGASPSEIVRVIKPDLDQRGRPPAYA
jgi:anaerobic selenocysteine-containing dehydrogenase